MVDRRPERFPGARQGRRRRWLRWAVVSVILLLAGVVLAHTVFVRWVSRAIVWAPNHGESILARRDPLLSDLVALGVSRHLRVSVGPPGASLSVWVIDPAGRQEPRGTLLILHGIRDTKRTMLGLGRALAARGYRAVLPDLRGHGRSSGDWLTFGAVESRDLSQLLDELGRLGLLAGRIGVYGASYGGATAILLAARDLRIAAVVAVAPFASAQEVIHAYMRRVYPRWLVPDAWIDRAIASAGEAAGFNPEEADPSQAIRRSSAPILLIHGRQDRIIGWKQSRRLHEAAPTRSRLILLEHAGHAAIFRDKDGAILRESLGWFDRWVALPKASAARRPEVLRQPASSAVFFSVRACDGFFTTLGRAPSGRLLRPARGLPARLDDAAGGTLPAGVPGGAAESFLPRAVPRPGSRDRGLASALPPLPAGRRDLLLRHPDPGRGHGGESRVRRGRPATARARPEERGRGEASRLRSRRGDPLHGRDPCPAPARGRRGRYGPRLRRRSLDARVLSGRGRRLEVLRGGQGDDGARPAHAPPVARSSRGRRGGGPLLPDRLGSAGGAALRHLGGRADARGLSRCRPHGARLPASGGKELR